MKINIMRNIVMQILLVYVASSTKIVKYYLRNKSLELQCFRNESYKKTDITDFKWNIGNLRDLDEEKIKIYKEDFAFGKAAGDVIIKDQQEDVDASCLAIVKPDTQFATYGEYELQEGAIPKVNLAITSVIGDSPLQEHSEVLFSCHANSGIPPANVTLFHYNQSMLQLNTGKEKVEIKKMLTFADDGGNVTCKASLHPDLRMEGTQPPSQTESLNVQFAPRIDVVARTEITEGDVFTIEIDVLSNPVATVSHSRLSNCSDETNKSTQFGDRYNFTFEEHRSRSHMVVTIDKVNEQDMNQCLLIEADNVLGSEKLSVPFVTSSSGSGLSVGVIVGIILACLTGLVLVGIGVLLVVKQQRNSAAYTTTATSEMEAHEDTKTSGC